MQKNWHFITYPKENIYYFLMKIPPKKVGNGNNQLVHLWTDNSLPSFLSESF
jgi:hypothetical protein